MLRLRLRLRLRLELRLRLQVTVKVKVKVKVNSTYLVDAPQSLSGVERSVQSVVGGGRLTKIYGLHQKCWGGVWGLASEG